MATSSEIEEDCLRFVLGGRPNVFEYIFTGRSSTWWSTTSELVFFFESKQCLLAWKLKKIAYISFSGEMKTECIRIYIWTVHTYFCKTNRTTTTTSRMMKLPKFGLSIHIFESQTEQQILLLKMMKLPKLLLYFKERTADRTTSERGLLTTLLQREADRELKKISSYGEVKSECIQIYVVQKINVEINPFRAAGFFLRGRNALLGNWRANVFEYILSGKSTWLSTPSELCVCFFFEKKECFAWKLNSECIWIYIIWKVNAAINLFRAVFFFWEEGTLCLEIEERMYSNIYCPESQRADRPLQSCIFFFERK